MVLLVLALAGALLFLRLGERSLWGPEGRWASVAREMRLSSNYFWPTINGVGYYDKPLLSYWLVLGAAHLTGGLNEAATRLPSAVSGLLGVGLLVLLARKLYDARTALLASFILATSYSYVFFSRTASADIETVTGVLAALCLFAHNEERANGWWVAGFWLIMAVTSLTKGLLGFVLPLLVIGTYSLLAEGWRGLVDRIFHGPLEKRLTWLVSRGRWFFNWKTIAAVALAGVIYYLPFALSQSRTHMNTGLYMVFRENVVRFFRPFDHPGPVYLYAYAIFKLMAPWCVFLPAALVQTQARSESKSDRFTLAYFWATFVFFTLSGSRREYYLLSILPAAALLVARLFAARRAELDKRARWLLDASYVLGTLVILVLGVVALLPPALRPGALSDLPGVPAPMVFGLFWLLMFASVVYALPSLRPERMALSVSVIAYLSLLHLFVFALPESESYRGEKEFAQAVRARLGDELSQLVLYRTGDPGLIFYLAAPGPLKYYGNASDLLPLLENNSSLWVISRDRRLADLARRGAVVAEEHEYGLLRSPHHYINHVLLRFGPAGAERTPTPRSPVTE